MDRARSLPPGGVMVNPWWFQRIQAEAALQRCRPEDLPVPHDGDLEVESNVTRESAAGCSGRGSSSGGSKVSPHVNRQRLRCHPLAWRSTHLQNLGVVIRVKRCWVKSLMTLMLQYAVAEPLLPLGAIWWAKLRTSRCATSPLWRSFLVVQY